MQGALTGFKEVKPMVFSGLYPIDTSQYEQLRDALAKLKLNDSSFSFEPETSMALGFGFRCGFLGLLHMEIIQERLEREFNLDLITTAPTVVYRIHRTDSTMIQIESAAKLPELSAYRLYRRAVYPCPYPCAERLCRRCACAL